MRRSQLIRARIVIGDLFEVLTWEHRDDPEHWVHGYRPIAEAMLRVSAASFPNDSIASHVKSVFTDEDET